MQKKPDFSNVKSGSDSSAAKPAARPDFGNVGSGSASSAERVDPPAAQTYTVVPGDTLSGIAKRLYGSAQRWREIYEANTDQISNPDLIRPGQVLNLPATPDGD